MSLYSVHDIPFQNHALFTAINHTNYFNPGQTKVICSDQLLYALKKIINWANPSTFQKSDSCYITNYDPETKIASPPIKTPYCCYTSDVFTFFGVMHIEQVSLKCTGELITGTGLEDVLGSAGLKTIGLMKSLCDVSSLKKARYGGQALGPVFHSQTTGATDLSGLNTWAERQEGPMFKYLSGIRDNIMNVNLVFKSQRDRNFELFIATLEKLCYIIFALDHVFIHETPENHIPNYVCEITGGFFCCEKKAIPSSAPLLVISNRPGPRPRPKFKSSASPGLGRNLPKISRGFTKHFPQNVHNFTRK